MIVVAIIGVLASIAYPAYVENTRATKRATAQADLMELASFMERYFTENNTYVGATIAASGVTNNYYTFTSPIPNLAAATFTLTAVPIGAQGDDKCGIMALTQTGAKTPTTDNCWR
ncbi:MAG: pilus assembly protein PilE [Piscirickettsiaceae bacterium]|nr:MAG: pilus assembly protein PilE [Piscirickettsiaceae bacterium]